VLSFKDRLGACRVRWGFGRAKYAVQPGLYKIGTPDESSPVLVSSNYKLTLDSLRKNLAGLDCWLLILDTKGVNVWCAAGKGTFGTSELIKRVRTTGLSKIVAHKRLILPQLGASGVSAHAVTRATGFSVIYGPVYARDIKAFIDAGNKATKEMRAVRFTLRDRVILTPVEMMGAVKVFLPVCGVLFLLNLFVARPFSLRDLALYGATILVGTVATPALLPVIPGKAFAFKGWLLGALSTALILWAYGWFAPPFLMLGIGYLLVLPAYSAFLAMNFTGSSTFTSFSGVLKEMKAAIPLIVASGSLGMIVLVVKALIG